MGQEQLHAVAFDQRFYATDESVYGTWVRPAATDAFKALLVSIDTKQAQRPRRDNRPTRGDYELILGDYENSWSAKGYVVPSGVAGTAPDIDVILRTAFGARTTVADTSVTYDTSDTQGDHGSFTLHRWSQVLAESLAGCWVDEFKLAVSGSDEPTFEASGGAASYYFTGASTLNGAMSTSDQMIVQSADANSFRTNSLVRIGANTNTGAGFRITAGTGPTFTIESAISASNAADVLPYMPAETVAGSPASGIAGSLSFGGSTIGPFTAFDVAIKNNHKAQRHALNPTVQDYVEGWREVTGSVTVKARRDMMVRLGNRLNAITTAVDIALVIGSVAGSIITINIDRARFEGSQINFPEGADEADVQIPFRALASAATASDEINVACT